MSIIAILNQKGGTGKTTAAVHFSSWLLPDKSVVLLDADAQQSSSNWIKNSQLSEKLTSLVKNDPEELFEILPELSQEYSHVIVDGPGSLSEVTKAILARCDLALVPCQPSGLDLHSSSKIIRFIRHAQELRGGYPQAAIFLSRATKGTNLLRESKEALAESVVPLLKGTIYQRQCIADAPSQGKTVFQMSGTAATAAKKDYESLFSEAIGVLNGTR